MTPARTNGLNITIKDVARELGLSHTTVSRALNDNPLISEATKVRVRAVAASLGYVPNLSARVMRGSALPVFALCIPELRNDFYASIAKTFADRCRDAGVRMLLAVTGDDPLVEQQEINAFIEARVSGVIATLSAEPTPATIAALDSLPSVQLVRKTDALASPVARLQEEAGCRTAVEHLIALGHRHIAYLGTDNSVSSGRDRIRGFSGALADAGIDPVPGSMQLLPPSERSGVEGVVRLLAMPVRPTALVIGTSQLTIGALTALRAANLSFPDDMSVVSYGDPSWFSLLTPPLTAVSLPIEAMVARAVDLLLTALNRSKVAQPTDDDLPTTLILRGSTAPPL